MSNRLYHISVVVSTLSYMYHFIDAVYQVSIDTILYLKRTCYNTKYLKSFLKISMEPKLELQIIERLYFRIFKLEEHLNSIMLQTNSHNDKHSKTELTFDEQITKKINEAFDTIMDKHIQQLNEFDTKLKQLQESSSIQQDNDDQHVVQIKQNTEFEKQPVRCVIDDTSKLISAVETATVIDGEIPLEINVSIDSTDDDNYEEGIQRFIDHFIQNNIVQDSEGLLSYSIVKDRFVTESLAQHHDFTKSDLINCFNNTFRHTLVNTGHTCKDVQVYNRLTDQSLENLQDNLIPTVRVNKGYKGFRLTSGASVSDKLTKWKEPETQKDKGKEKEFDPNLIPFEDICNRATNLTQGSTIKPLHNIKMIQQLVKKMTKQSVPFTFSNFSFENIDICKYLDNLSINTMADYDCALKFLMIQMNDVERNKITDFDNLFHQIETRFIKNMKDKHSSKLKRTSDSASRENTLLEDTSCDNSTCKVSK